MTKKLLKGFVSSI